MDPPNATPIGAGLLHFRQMTTPMALDDACRLIR